MKHTRIILGSTLAALALLAGCQGHGDRVASAKAGAAARLDGLKAATEFQMAEAAFSNEDLEKALKHVSMSIQLNPNVVRSHVLLGKVFMEKGDFEQAAKALEHAESFDPKAVEPQYYLGLLNERTARKEAALARYLKAAELDPSDAQYTLAAAEVMIDLGQVPEAKQFLDERRTQLENNAAIRQTLGHIAMMQGDVETAVKEFSDARLLSPDNQGIAEDLARAYFETEQFAEAESILTRLLTSNANKERRDLQLMQANCFAHLDRLADARELLIALTTDAAGTRDVDAFIALGNVSYMMKDMVRLRQTASRIIAIAPRRSEGYLLRALHMRYAGDFTNAESSAKQAAEFGGGAEAWMLLGMIQKDAGQDDQANASFARAAELGAVRPDTTAGASEPHELN